MASKVVGMLRSYKEILKVVVVIAGVYCFQVLAHLDLFRCPCSFHKYYGIAFLLGPAIFLLGLSLVVCKRSWSVIVACWKYNNPKTKCNYFLESLVYFFKPFLAPVSWLVLGLLRGDYYVCIRAGPPQGCITGKEKTHPVDFDLLYAQSFVIGSACLVAMVIFSTGIVCIQHFCTNKAEYLPTLDDLIQLRSKAIATAFDEKAKKVVNEFAVNFVESSFCVRDPEVDVDERFTIARERVLKNYERRELNNYVINCPDNDLNSMEFTSISTM